MTVRMKISVDVISKNYRESTRRWEKSQVSGWKIGTGCVLANSPTSCTKCDNQTWQSPSTSSSWWNSCSWRTSTPTQQADHWLQLQVHNMVLWSVSTSTSSIPYFLLLKSFYQNYQSKFHRGQNVSKELRQYSILYSSAENKFLQAGRESWARRISEGWQTTWGDWVIVIGGTNFNARLKTPLELWEVIWNDVWRK